jgi:hypothetical protein
MKVTLEFDTDEPGEYREMLEATRASKLAISLWDIDQFLRNLMKYENVYHEDYLTEEEDNLAEFIRDKVHEIIKENDVEFVFEG